MENKDVYLDLGKCELTDADFLIGSLVSVELTKCIQLETLVLSNEWYDYRKKRVVRSINAHEDNRFFNADFTPIIKLSKLSTLICNGGTFKQWGIGSLKIIGTLTNLVHLSLCNNHIIDLSSLANLKHLNYLDVSDNTITDLTGLENLKDLEYLDITNNNIHDIAVVTTLPKLTYLYIGQNKITSISYNTYLKYFTTHEINYQQAANNLAGYYFKASFRDHINQIQLICESIRRERFQARVDNEAIFQKNKTAIDDSLLLTQLATNSMTAPPLEIIKRDSRRVIDWYEARKQGGVINMIGKVILFGNGEVGKTTLVHQLTENEFLANTERTHGIRIRTWTIGIEEFSKELIAKIELAISKYATENPDSIKLPFPKTIQLNLWDFGGQEYYHATHRLFMSSNVMYLILWDSKTDLIDEEAGVYPRNYWKRNIDHFSTRNTVLNIQNKTQKNTQGTDGKENFKIRLREATIPKSISQYEHDIDDLKMGIFDNLAGLSYIGQPFPMVYEEIRKALKNELRKYINFSEYEDICRKVDNTLSSVMTNASQRETLLQFLDDTGSIVSFRYRNTVRSALLDDLIFTDPEWLTGIIYEILSKQKNEFEYNHVEVITKTHDLDTSTWIEIMKQFELIFEIQGSDGICYIVPQYLPLECREPNRRKSALAGKQMLHAFTLSYPGFFPKSNFLRFLARYGSKSDDYLYWKNGLVFTKSKTVEALCNNDFNDGKIEIFVQDRDPQLTKEVFEVLLGIDEAENIEISINREDYVTVKKLKEKIHGRYHSIEATNEKTLLMSEFNHLFNIQSVRKKIFISYAHEDKGLRDEFNIYLSPFVQQEKITIWHDNKLEPGLWEEQIEKQMEQTDIFIFLVTKNFCNSNYIIDKEIIKAIDRYEKGLSKIFPVICEDCAWHFLPINKSRKQLHPVERIEMYPWLGQLTAFPTDGVPLNQWEHRSEGFTEVLSHLVQEFSK
ncbi:COR domain-containing protein [Mucilaginibacter flavus]|uniref:leucine-rich repeat domain-containing protein n=1 Tax=Mucilaginibacter flavus TaxID=931504 RepID=UPI0025B32678|nr:COR domain-containing protein [Mucilaginibacter flavus]MDN3582499.1 COR domain-containing protein [Mucilaginibacter flavus]